MFEEQLLLLGSVLWGDKGRGHGGRGKNKLIYYPECLPADEKKQSTPF